MHVVARAAINVVRLQADIMNWCRTTKRAGVLDEETAFPNQWADEGWRGTVRPGWRRTLPVVVARQLVNNALAHRLPVRDAA